MKHYQDQILQGSINGYDLSYRELKCRHEKCGRTFSSHTFETECPRCKRLRETLQRKCYKAGVSYSKKVLDVALALVSAFPNSRHA